MDNKLNVEELAIFCKKKGFTFQAAEIYGGLAGFFDFGPLGVELKNNIKQSFWKKFVKKRDDMFGQDGSIITNPRVWKASGHVDTFGDLLLTTKESKTKLRADHFIEDQLNILADGLSADEINNLIKKHDLKYNGEEFEKVKFFNVMFTTQVGADPSKSSTAYLRPETAQSIFPNFKSISEVSRAKLPFGICQIGKSFRNEISPRDFVFRSREFEQMEIEYFVKPNTECDLFSNNHKKTKIQFLSAKNQDDGIDKVEEISFEELVKKSIMTDYHAYWICEMFKWYTKDLGINPSNLRLREHTKTELSHYAIGTFDIDYRYPFGFKELHGIANRGNYDLKQHQEHSKKSLEIFDEESKKKLLPSVIEPAVGVERIFAALLFEAYNDNKERGNIHLKLSPQVSPYKVAIFPLMNKEELTKVATKIHENLKENDIDSFYDKSSSIGKRYARQDEIGTPYCITIDYETIEEGDKKNTVTIRDRDSTDQKRIQVQDLDVVINKLIKNKIDFNEL